MAFGARMKKWLTRCFPFHSSSLAETREYFNSIAYERHLAKKSHYFIGCLVDPLTNPLMQNTRKAHNELYLTLPYLLWSRSHLNLNSAQEGFIKEFFLNPHYNILSLIRYYQNPDSGDNEEEVLLV